MRISTVFGGLGAWAFAIVLTGCGETNSVVGASDAIEGRACSTEGRTARAADGCNECECSSAGTWVCTDMACGTACEPGETKPADDGCNDCICTESGDWACTDVACPTGCVYDGRQYAEGERFPASDGCNECSCSAGEVGCTLKDCAPRCVPGTTRDAGDECNRCTCDADGSWQCTLAECPGVATCVDDSECPTIDAECENCRDGSVACPSYTCLERRCVLLQPSCNPAACSARVSCPEVDADCLTCGAGTLCPEYECLESACVLAQPICSTTQR